MSNNRLLRIGHHGEDVKELQIKLNKFGYNLDVDGIFGALTDKAVRAFQKSRGLVVDGIVGPLTRGELDRVVGNKNKFYIYKNAYVIEVDPLDLYINVVKKSGILINGDFINGSFFDMKNMRSISTLVQNGNILAEQLGHDMVKRGTFIVYNNGDVSVEMIDFISKYSRLKDIKFAIGGFNILPNVSLKEQLKREWFDYNVVGYRTWRSMLGYSKEKKKALVVIASDTDAQQGSSLLKELGCDIGIGLDSGGSTCGTFNGRVIRNTNRIIHNIIRW